jgi:chorismate-pyruvate lyase
MNSPTPIVDVSVVHDPSLSLFQKVLLVTDGTVTQLIELYTGESIRVRKIENQIVGNHVVPTAVQHSLQTDDGNALLKRIILLCGEAKSYLYAESYFVMERLPADMRSRLETTNIPIGLLWREARLETHREIIAYHRERNADVAAHLGVDADAELLSRTYLLYTNRQPMGMISEKFPASYFVK